MPPLERCDAAKGSQHLAVVRDVGHRRRERGGVGLPQHAYLDQPVEIWIDLLGPVRCESVPHVEPSSPRVVLGHPQLCRPPSESLVKESLTDTMAVAAGQHVEGIQLLIPRRRVPLVLGSRTVSDKPHDSAFAPGDTDPLPGILLGEQTRPHHPSTLARGVIVETLREQLSVGFPPRLHLNRSHFPSISEVRHHHLKLRRHVPSHPHRRLTRWLAPTAKNTIPSSARPSMPTRPFRGGRARCRFEADVRRPRSPHSAALRQIDLAHA